MREEDQLEIVKMNKGDEDQQRFIKDHLRDFYTPAILDWQYGTNANVGGLFFTKSTNQYIASQGMLPIDLKVKGKMILSAKSESSFLLPSYRKRGIFEKLYAHTITSSEQDGVEVIWGFTALSKVWKHKLHFETFDGIIHEAELQTSLSNDISQSLKSLPSAKLKGIVKAFYAMFKRIGRLKVGASKYEARKMDFKNEEDQKKILSAYTNWSEQYSSYVHIAPTKEFLNWRVVTNPMIKYEFVGLYSGNELLAVAIVNVSKVKAYIVDLILLEGSDLKFCLATLINFIKKRFSISHVLYWANSKNEYNQEIFKTFKSFGGFIYQNNSMNFVLWKNERVNRLNNLKDINSFCINGLWTEGFGI